MSITDINNITGSAVLKRDWRKFTDTGFLDSQESQASYLSCYLPARFVASDAGKEFYLRAWDWLRGRYACPPSLRKVLW